MVPATKSDEETRSWPTASSSCSGSSVREPKRRKCCSKRHRHQPVASAGAHRLRGPTIAVPLLWGSELPGGCWDPAPRAWHPGAAGPRPLRGGGSGRAGGGGGAALPLRPLRRGAHRGPLRGAWPAGVQRLRHRARLGALGSAGRDGSPGAAPGVPGDGPRGRWGDGLGDLATLGAGHRAEAALPVGAPTGPLRVAAPGGGHRGVGAGGERGSDDPGAADRAPRLPRRRAGVVRGPRLPEAEI
jgi:hypothetical protein